MEMASYNIKEMQEFLEDLPDDLAKLLTTKLIPMYASKIVNEAQQNAPVKTGYLKRSITFKMQKDSKGRAEAVIYAGADYGIYVEFGKPNRQAKPFLIPAYLKWSEKFYDALLADVEDALN